MIIQCLQIGHSFVRTVKLESMSIALNAVMTVTTVTRNLCQPCRPLHQTHVSCLSGSWQDIFIHSHFLSTITRCLFYFSFLNWSVINKEIIVWGRKIWLLSECLQLCKSLLQCSVYFIFVMTTLHWRNNDTLNVVYN